MKKRVVIALLWTYTAWYAGAMAADLLTLSPWLGPILALTVAGLFAAWGHRSSAKPSSQPSAITAASRS